MSILISSAILTTKLVLFVIILNNRTRFSTNPTYSKKNPPVFTDISHTVYETWCMDWSRLFSAIPGMTSTFSWFLELNKWTSRRQLGSRPGPPNLLYLDVGVGRLSILELRTALGMRIVNETGIKPIYIENACGCIGKRAMKCNTQDLPTVYKVVVCAEAILFANTLHAKHSWVNELLSLDNKPADAL